MTCANCNHTQPLQRTYEGAPFGCQGCHRCGHVTHRDEWEGACEGAPAVGNAPEELAPAGYFGRLMGTTMRRLAAKEEAK